MCLSVIGIYIWMRKYVYQSRYQVFGHVAQPQCESSWCSSAGCWSHWGWMLGFSVILLWSRFLVGRRWWGFGHRGVDSQLKWSHPPQDAYGIKISDWTWPGYLALYKYRWICGCTDGFLVEICCSSRSESEFCFSKLWYTLRLSSFRQTAASWV